MRKGAGSLQPSQTPATRAQGPVKLKTVLIAYRAAANPSKDEDARLVLWSDDAASLLTPIYIMNINAPIIRLVDHIGPMHSFNMTVA